MNDSNLAELETLFLALSDTTRLKLLSLMAKGEVSVGYLADTTGESQPKVSRHLAYLRTAGLVAARREGKHIFYGIKWPTEPMAANVIAAVLGNDLTPSIAVDTPAGHERSATKIAVHNTFAEAYVNDYVPQEIEIYLL